MFLRRAALFFGLFALLVNGPRFVLTFLRVDSELLNSQLLPSGIERLLLTATGVGTAIVLTGGGMRIAHVLAKPTTPRGMVRAFLAVCWGLLLAFTVVILAPGFVAAIRTSDLADVLSSNSSQWSWSVVAVLAVEVLAAAAIAGATLLEGAEQEADQPAGPSAMDQPTEVGLQRVLTWLQTPEQQARAREQPAATASVAEQLRSGLHSGDGWHPERDEKRGEQTDADSEQWSGTAASTEFAADAAPATRANRRPSQPQPSASAVRGGPGKAHSGRGPTGDRDEGAAQPEEADEKRFPCPQTHLGCDFVGQSQRAVNAHQRFCGYRENP